MTTLLLYITAPEFVWWAHHMMCGCVLCLHKQESAEQKTFPIYGFVPTVVSGCGCGCGVWCVGVGVLYAV